MKYVYVTIIIGIIFQTTFAQSQQISQNKQAQKAYDEAGKFISYKQYEKAADELKTAIQQDATFTAAYLQLADIYRLTENFALAKNNYLKVIQLAPSFYMPLYFNLGEIELKTGDYEAAKQHLKKYLSYPSATAKTKKLAEKYLVDCDFSLDAIKHPVEFKPVNLGAAINSADLEYVPAVTADEEKIIFTRQQEKNEDFFESLKSNKKWQKAISLSSNINTKEFNEGTQCISPDGQYLFFTGCNRPDGMGRCDIYLSKREGTAWSKPYNLGYPINSEAWESQPSISADGKILYFSSSRPGGLGGNDIWKSELKDDASWSVPVNLGENINTAFDEETPFIHADNETLYFSSAGWPGLGNKDLFITRKDTSGKWQKPENLGYPINTFSNEGGIFISATGNNAYYSADRPGGFGGYDIYTFSLPPKAKPKLVTYVKGAVHDRDSREPLQAYVTIIDLKTQKQIYKEVAEADSGSFLATLPAGRNYSLNIRKTGYLFYSENFSLSNSLRLTEPYLLKIELAKIASGEAAVLKNIFFNTNSYELLPSSKAELKELVAFLNQNPGVSIEIGGYTDNVGEIKSNQILSERRANALLSFLISSKISSSRLTAKGYGELNPIGNNTTENGRQSNRRTAIKITSTKP